MNCRFSSTVASARFLGVFIAKAECTLTALRRILRKMRDSRGSGQLYCKAINELISGENNKGSALALEWTILSKYSDKVGFISMWHNLDKSVRANCESEYVLIKISSCSDNLHFYWECVHFLLIFANIKVFERLERYDYRNEVNDGNRIHMSTIIEAHKYDSENSENNKKCNEKLL